MKYQQLKGTDIKIPCMTLGAWGMGGGTAWGDVDDAQSVRLIHQALDYGINAVDTAPVYGAGHSEVVLGKALQGKRDKYIISTKCGLQWRDEQGKFEYSRDGNSVYRNLSAASIRQDLEDSMKRLGVDYIDIYFTHRQPATLAEVAETAGALAEMQKQGKIRAVGISQASPEYLAEYLRTVPVVMVQEQFNLIERKNEAYIVACEQHGVLFQGFSPLARGLLTGKIGMDYVLDKADARAVIGWFAPEKRKLVLEMLDGMQPLCKKYDCSVAVLMCAWALGYAENYNMLFGARRIESLTDTVKAASLQLEAADRAEMDAAAQRLFDNAAAL